MTAPRIDSVRRDINDAITSLRFLATNLEDVHVLAYNRHKAAQEAKVRGGTRDYALDTHGDPEARRIYADTARIAERLIDEAIGMATDMRSWLTEGKGGSRKDTSADCSADEIVAALAARRRRKERGEYEPALIAQQPVVVPSMDWKTECEVLRTAVRKVTGEFLADHTYCQPADHGIGRFKRKLLRRFPTKNLSAREREAWQRAIQSVAATQTEIAS